MRKFSRHRAPSPHQSLLKAIQAHFGLTQEQLSQVLDVSRVALNQYDAKGKARNLPTTAVLRLLAWQQLLPAPHGPAPTPPVPVVLAPLPAADRETLDFRRREIALQQYRLEQKLAQCRVHLAQARLRQQALPALHVAFSPADELTEQWLKWLERDSRAILAKEEPAALLLALRLRVLAFEVKEIEQLLAQSA
ncbi:hypothetical protein LRS06_15350 [Hymenobacter sp. J193]|uniref:hypothetical protein n=1 Tax=Hymenobacter sp. J193 TaxID=2898429 RepID=UPI002150CDC2|nr:hypothetical protein [Hymenobacter sp. J193]MCR5889113.1 hypothetical protein [Hymenobacter sp. J193]